MATKKNLKYYMGLNWSYTIEQEVYKGKRYYIIRVNELPGICTDAETVEEGMRDIRDAIEGAVRLYLKNKEPIPEPIQKERFKGQIAYRTTSERHYYVAKAAKVLHKSISKTIDDLIDAGLERLNAFP
ncbi:MAG: type II toxin-antitoxin system HicB family antitoxin [Verrucomicrobia bacterium]|nr:type II toxin-antitoxin system HicB family antitoxin [Verrucomicrobiota bacterium]